MNKFFLIACTILLMASCYKQPHYQKSYSFKKHEWKQTVKPRFEVQIDDTSKAYDFIITLRNNTDYQFSNLWIYLNSKTPKGEKSREPYQIRIVDDYGKWLGKKTGSSVENNVVFSKRKMPYPGKYIFEIEQGIIQESVNNLLDITFIVRESEVK